jgi:hypothetical protein
MQASSKVQWDAALSLKESEYIAMLEAFRVLSPMIDLLEESKKNGVPNMFAYVSCTF